MNLPNKLTILRVILVPVFLAFLYAASLPHRYFYALAVFIIAALTDMADGKIARARHLITNFGKFLDPLADKLLVTAALICLIPTGYLPALVVLVIVGRDTAVNGLRSVAAAEGKVIAANIFGKIKTFAQMVAVCMTLLLLGLAEYGAVPAETAGLVSRIVWWIIAAYTFVTMIIYFAQNASCIDPRK